MPAQYFSKITNQASLTLRIVEQILATLLMLLVLELIKTLESNTI
jgi:hypothetical protein